LEFAVLVTGLPCFSLILLARVDRARYLATPLISDGNEGPPLELRALFEQFVADLR
jgi:hypothetical protein